MSWRRWRHDKGGGRGVGGGGWGGIEGGGRGGGDRGGRGWDRREKKKCQ